MEQKDKVTKGDVLAALLALAGDNETAQDLIASMPTNLRRIFKDVPRCWRCGAELPATGDTCASCGESQVPF